LDALGLELSYPDTGPHLGRKLNAETIKTLRPLEEAWPALEFQGAAVRATREVLPRDCSLIGFVGGPWTLFGYAVEGSHRGTLAPTKRLLPLFGEFCRHLMPLLKRNIAHQLANGAELVLVIDTAAGELPAAMFAETVTPHLAEIASAFSGQVGYYAKGAQPAHFRSPLFTGGGFAGVGVDYRWDLREAFLLLNGGFVQGNFDPALLTTDAATLEKRLRRYLEPLREVDRAGWVCGLGHGVLPETPPDNVRRFVEIAREVLR
jgi:uroporphyrinogen decarboxylase